MQTKSTNGNPTVKDLVTYRITVQGSLPPSYSDRLAGMRITTTSRWDQKPVTALEGPVRDQSELFGVLNSLYELHLTLLSVQTQQPKPRKA